MAFMNVLEINGETLPFPDSYDVDLSDVEADSSGETEAGTKQSLTSGRRRSLSGSCARQK